MCNLLQSHKSLYSSITPRSDFTTANITITMAALWNPRALLGVDPDGVFTCVGTTKKGTRCRNSFISNSDLAKASNLLDRMATSDPWDARAHLSYLAEITLCPRWHRKSGYSQVESMKHKWWDIIVSNYPDTVDDFYNLEPRARSEKY
jgi:hypothetical protein